MEHRVAQPESLVLPPPDDLMQIMGRPAPVIAHPAWRDARDKILDLVQTRCHLIAILGPAGSGKTTLLRDLAETLERDRAIAFFSEFSDDSCDFPPDSVVLADEAERLSAASFDVLARHADITVILTALPSFYGRFMEFREGIVVPLPLLTDHEAMAFLREWMAHFGLSLDCVTRDAWERLIAHCRGVPRLLASLLKLALFVGADEPSPRVALKQVEMAISVQGGSAETNLAEMAGLSPTVAPHDTEDEVPAFAQSELEIPPLEPAVAVYEAGGAGLQNGLPSEEPVEKKRARAHGWRIAGWTLVGGLCLAAVALMLLWNYPRLLKENFLLAQNTPVEAPAAPLATEKIPPATSPPVPASAPNGNPPPETSQAPESTPPLPGPPITDAPPPVRTSQAPPVEGQPPGGQGSIEGSRAGAANDQSVAAEAPKTSVEAKARPVEPAMTATTPLPPPPVPTTITAAIPDQNSQAPASGGPAKPAGQTSATSSPAPTIAPAAPAGITLPSGASIRIVVTYAWGDEGALQRSLEISRILRASGFTVLDPFPVPPKRSKKGIRYYFVQDAGVADTIVHRLGGDYGAATLVRFSVIEGLPRPGTIEVDVARE